MASVVQLEERRVKITDSRMYVVRFYRSPASAVLTASVTTPSCPQCYKRLGNSVIAIHSPKSVLRFLLACVLLTIPDSQR